MTPRDLITRSNELKLTADQLQRQFETGRGLFSESGLIPLLLRGDIGSRPVSRQD